MRRLMVSSLFCGALVAGVFGGTAAGNTRKPQGTTTNTQSLPLAPLPQGNPASAFAFDPRRPNVVYVASADARGGVYVFKTSDGGQYWRSTGARGGGWRSDVLSLTSDPRHRSRLYAGTDTAVYKTVDGGRTWRPFRHGLFPRRHRFCDSSGFGGPPPTCQNYRYFGTPGKTDWNRNNGWVLDVAVDPVHGNVVYAAAGAVRRSTDGGRIWRTVFKPKRKRSMVSRVAIAPTHPESVYAITHAYTVTRYHTNDTTTIYKSTNAGRTWQVTGGGHSSLPPSCCGDSQDALAVDPANPQTLYAVVGNTVFATANGGASWKPMANGLPASAVTSLVADPRQPGTLYASVDIPHTYQPGDVEKPTGGIYQTTDGGKTWTKLWSGFGVDKVAIDPTRPSTIYAAGWIGRNLHHDSRCGNYAVCVNIYRLLRSTDGGHTWAIAR